MFKKALILSLAVCMLSVNVFAGTALLSMASDYTELQGPVKEETVTVKPEAVEVLQSSDGSTQTITYYGANELPGAETKTNTGSGATERRWFYFRVPLNGLTSVTAASGSAGIRYNNGGTTFNLKSIDKATWETATKNLASNTKTIASDSSEWLAVPGSDLTGLWAQKLSSSTSSIATYSIEDERLTENINTAAEKGEDYVYFAAYAYISGTKDGCATTLNSWSFTLTGVKPIEGLSASIVGEKTERVYFNDIDNIALVKKDVATNTYTGEESYVQIETNATKGLDTLLYLRADLTAFAGKEITKVEFSVQNRLNSAANTTFIYRTDAAWLADGEGEIGYTNQPTVDSAVAGVKFVGNTKANAVETADITSLVKNLTASNNVLSLKVQCNMADDKIYGIRFFDIGKTTDNAPQLVITYKDEVTASDKVEDSFTYTATVEEGETVRLVVGVYGAGDAFLGSFISEATVSDGETAIELPVSLSAYTDATYIKAYMWEDGTLVPYFAPIMREVA